MKENKEMERKEQGITLIALVITVIVLLILAGISIAMLTGENGIITQAVKAKEETEKASVIEQAQTDILGIQAGGDTTLTQKQLKDVLSKYFDSVPDDVDTDDTLTTKEEYGGKYQIAVSDIYNGELKGVVSIPEGLEIGATVSYNPSGTYEFDPDETEKKPLSETYSGSSSNPTQLDSSSDEFNIDTWKVFDIDEDTGEVTLVPEHSTANLEAGAGGVYLEGAQGYNNAVKLLNDACSNLYGDSSKRITARSINITDIEGKMTEAALQQAHNYSDAAKYGEQVANAYSQNCSHYPSIYAQEILNGVNGTQSSSGLKMSEQTSLIEPGENNGAIPGNGLRPTQTYWYEDNRFMQSAFETASNGTSYYSLLMPDGSNTYYWVASRSVNPYSSFCDFSVCCVDGGEVNAGYVFGSSNGNYDYCYGLFPVVSLSSELISVNESGDFEVK